MTTDRASPAEDRERIFEPYVRAGDGSRAGGLGLGLAICKRIVEAHGGAILVTDAPGGGSRFSFTLRAADAETSLAMTAKRRILVVDDAEGIRSYLASLLELRGFQVDTAEDGQSALALLESGAAPDLIILDVMMPGIDGLETLRRIRARDPEVPVVMLSVVGKAATIVEAMQLGATDYLNKPFEEEELELTISKAFERRDLEAECQQLRADLGPDAAAEPTVWEGETLGGDPRAPRTDLRHRRQRPDPGRERRRQGDRGPGGPLDLAAAGQALREGQLRGASHGASRERALRLREGRVHRGQRPKAGKVRARATAAPSSSTRSGR